MDESKQVHFQKELRYSYKELYEALRLFYRRDNASRKVKYAGLFSLFLFILTLQDGISAGGIFLLIIGVTSLFLQRPALKLYAYLAYNSFPSKEFKTAIDKNGVEYKSKYKHSHFNWDDVQYLHNDQMIVLYGPLFIFLFQLIIISKDKLDEEDWEKVLEIVKENVKPKKKLSYKTKALQFVLGTTSLFLFELDLFVIYALIAQNLGQNVGLNLDPELTWSLTYFTLTALFFPILWFGAMQRMKYSIKSLALSIGIGLVIFLALFGGSIFYSL